MYLAQQLSCHHVATVLRSVAVARCEGRRGSVVRQQKRWALRSWTDILSGAINSHNENVRNARPRGLVIWGLSRAHCACLMHVQTEMKRDLFEDLTLQWLLAFTKASLRIAPFSSRGNLSSKSTVIT